MFSSRERDVSSSLAEFAAGLEKACPGCVTRRASPDGGALFSIDVPDAGLDVFVRPGQPRAIASLSLPTLQVRFEARRGAARDVDALIGLLDRSMHRGGG